MILRNSSRLSPLAIGSLLGCLLAWGCGDDAGPADGGEDATDMSGGDMSGSDTGGDMPGRDMSGDGATDMPRPPLEAGAFRRGVNPGYYGPGIDRRESAMLSANAGINSMRLKMPDYYLARWGAEIEVGDYAFYATQGLDQHVVFLIGMREEYSSAPAGTEQWELDHYAPENLYEPIFLGDGSVNPENYWAAHVASVAQNYGDHIGIYEVWNEPDQVGGNWRVTEEWDARAPTAEELPWWGDSIYAYVRAMRVAHEVVHRFDPNACVTVGGVGYSNFLRAVLRYSDAPSDGAVGGEYPAPGAAYMDCLSFHYYPIFGGGSSDQGVDGLLDQAASMREALAEHGLEELPLVVTESGAPREAVGDYPGGATYAASYLIKAMTLAQFDGWMGIDWFAQGGGDSDDAFELMGLYYDYSSAETPDDAVRSPQGDAYAWLASWIDGAAPDPALLASLSLPEGVRGASFERPDGRALLVLWARTAGDESATATLTLPLSGEVQLLEFSVEGGPAESTRAASGELEITLGSIPTALVY